jgi:hypothetical protein
MAIFAVFDRMRLLLQRIPQERHKSLFGCLRHKRQRFETGICGNKEEQSRI